MVEPTLLKKDKKKKLTAKELERIEAYKDKRSHDELIAD